MRHEHEENHEQVLNELASTKHATYFSRKQSSHISVDVKPETTNQRIRMGVKRESYTLIFARKYIVRIVRSYAIQQHQSERHHADMIFI